MQIKINNGVYTKEICFVFKNFEVLIQIKSIKWLCLLYQKKIASKIIYHSKNIKSYKKKGKLVQITRKKYTFFIFSIGWIITKEHDKHKAYSFYHHKRYLNLKDGFFERLKKEIMYYLKKARA